jgi:hypothetical protein
VRAMIKHFRPEFEAKIAKAQPHQGIPTEARSV